MKIFLKVSLSIILLLGCTNQGVERKISLSSDSLAKYTISDTDNFNSARLEQKQLVDGYDLKRIDTFKVGDVDGNGKRDTAFVLPFKFYYKGEKLDSAFTCIHFSKTIPDIHYENGYQGTVVNVGDLDGNGTSEILYHPDWFSSNWGRISVFGLKKHKWVLFAEGTIYGGVEGDQDITTYLKSRVRKVNNHCFLLKENLMTGDGTVPDTIRKIYLK